MILSYQFAQLRIVLLMLVVLIPLSGCLRSGADDQSQQVPAASFFLEISSNATTATTGKPITFKALSKGGDSPAPQYRWRTSDGQVGEGPQATFSFRQAGRVDVSLDATTTDGRPSTTAVTSVFIFGSVAIQPTSLGLPAIMADANGDGQIDILDSLATAQGLYGIAALTNAQRQAADIDLDGSITSRDLALSMQAVISKSRFPTAILNDFIYPGGVLSIVSPELLDPDAAITIRVNGIPTASPVRAALGYLTAVAPLELPAGPEVATIELLVGEGVVSSLQVPLRRLPAMPSEAANDILEFIGQTKTILSLQQDVLTKQLQATGVAPADQTAILAAAQAGNAMLDSSANDLKRIFASDRGRALAQLFQKELYANGLAEFRSENPLLVQSANAQDRRQALATLTGDQVCDVLIPNVCDLKKIARRAEVAGNILNAACTATAIAVITVGIEGGPITETPILLGVQEVCVPLSVAATIGSVAGELFSPIDMTLNGSAKQITSGANSTWMISSSITMHGLDGICGTAAEAGADRAIEKVLGDRIFSAALRKNASISFLAKIFSKFGERFYANFVKAINDSVNKGLSETGIAEAFGKLISNVCPSAINGVVNVPVKRVFHPPKLGEGVLQFNADGTGTYFCPPAGPAFKSNVTLIGELQLCQSNKAQISTDVTCVASAVTITIGDNGSALDDIFEVVINGETVLTSSGPVRSVSKQLFLPQGRTTVTMRGLAAPDGIGTYFIEFSGAAVVSGVLSGTDLVPGVSKQFVIEVF